MKAGYKVLIHKDIKDDDLQMVLEYCKANWSPVDGKPRDYRVGFTCSRSFWRRGIAGKCINWQMRGNEGDPIVFRRLCKNRRVFGAIPVRLLEKLDGSDLVYEGCHCAEHFGGTRVRIKGGFNEADFDVLYEVGEIKG